MARIAVKLHPKAEKAVKKGHPWIYETSISKISTAGNAGDLCILYDQRRNKLFAIGLYDPDSPIRIKVIHTAGPIVVDRTFWEGKIRSARSLRQSLLETDTNSYRLLHGENDGMPGLIVDIYDQVVVTKIYSKIWLPYIDTIYDVLCDIIDPKAIVQRVSRNVAATTSLPESSIVRGRLDDPIVHFTEHGIRFSAHVLLGHKTGYFLDHRHNRLRVGRMSKDKSVLDIFSYAGGFSAHAAAGGATSVTSIDISKQALEVAQYNVNLNPNNCKHLVMAMDAFAALSHLESERKCYDIVVVDPPSFAKKEEEIQAAIKSYQRLAKQAVKLVRADGILVLASCSARVSRDQFFSACNHGLAMTTRKYQLLDKTYHDIDHPITYPQGAYLKTAYYSIT